jgi:hypothetical protein
MRCDSRHFEVLRDYIGQLPVVDCHDHTYRCEPAWRDPIQYIVSSYYEQDLLLVLSQAEVLYIKDASIPLEKRWPVFEKGWNKSMHTGYAQCVRRVVKRFYDIDELSLEALRTIRSNVLDLEDEGVFEGILDQANIQVRLEDLGHLAYAERVTQQVLDGTFQMSPKGRLVIGLPCYHDIRCYDDIYKNMEPLGKTVTSLDEYLDGCRQIFEGYKAFGAVAFKDQSAYKRSLHYSNATKSQAEQVFNRLIENPRYIAGYPDEIAPLDDFLFHEFLRMACNLDLPVQIHTGHMAAAYNDIRKANAVLLTSVLELHRDVKFDLIHANWPYSAELLFLAKNYPNVAIDFAWTHIIDPVYCIEMMKQAISSVPHGKIHAFGSDFCGMADLAWAHAEMAKDHIAIALSEMIDQDYIDMDAARHISRDWLFENPKRFFSLTL